MAISLRTIVAIVGLRGRLLRPALAGAFAALLLAGCGGLPQRSETPRSDALPPSAASPLAKLVEVSTPPGDATLTGFRLMPTGLYSLDARIELAKRAQRSLDVQYYQIHNDMTGHLLLRTLRDAARRGVRVRLLVDDLYTVGGDDMFAGFDAFDNVEVRLFNPFCCGRDGIATKFVASLADFRRLNHRMHNKLFIADSAVVVAGGRNIADEYFMRSMTDNFVDMDALFVGAVVPQLVAIFDAYWNSRHVFPIGDVLPRAATREQAQARFNAIVDEGEQMMALALPPIDILGYGPVSDEFADGRLGLHWGKATAFADSPEKVAATSAEMARRMSVTMSVMDLVIAARSDVVLSSPYFVPGAMGVQAFGDLTRRKVKVTVLTNSLASNDEPLVHTGYARYRRELLRSGVDLYELSPTRSQGNRRLMIPGASRGRLHAKTAVIDRRLVFIGSMNLDPRSANQNTELGIIVESPELAKEVLRVIHISKLQSAYRLQLAQDDFSLEWLTMDDDKEVVLLTEPDTTVLYRVQNWLFAPFVPEQQL
ncbi:MAG: phospholipase D family protein [Burkholderiales bacterium]|nr:phospholipase D family protein [Burkholderiales bacterium]